LCIFFLMIGSISSRWLYDFLTVFFKGGVFQNSLSMNFNNELWLPVVTVFICDDQNLAISKNPIILNANQTKEVNLTACATKENIGHNGVPVDIVTYPEILPAEMIAKLAKLNIALSLFLVCSLPVGIITLICYGIDRKSSRR